MNLQNCFASSDSQHPQSPEIILTYPIIADMRNILLPSSAGIRELPETWLVFHNAFSSNWSDGVMIGRGNIDMILRYVSSYPTIGYLSLHSCAASSKIKSSDRRASLWPAAALLFISNQ
ncbi:hypothetical protein TNIN_151731 [Trichonephila inaurata madagascariensis]|uniref:Uncharacterized protein n=1 Tax=Trichonephila inaurata madagascariensis TaxID=2747483 RepID=A0A8X6WSI0_9ARAC|nr:hypothetical protein TNIN_151731 [Trichonephila inaurata madagascariensis]